MDIDLSAYKREVEAELENILAYWMEQTLDSEEGGFLGKIDANNVVHKTAPKGSVLNSRILWAFSAAYRHTGREEYLRIADRACRYLLRYFVDEEWGGVYWTVDYKGAPLDTKKQIYALAFAVYGLSEYYRCAGAEEAKGAAIDLYRTIVQYSYDAVRGGYIEAFTQDWQAPEDLRLSNKDSNEKKTMNTHLHLLEGFANLYRIWPDAGLKENITELIAIFPDHITDKNTGHLTLFFDERWLPKSDIVSYGHDIEGAWLIQEAAELIGDQVLSHQIRSWSVRLAEASAEGLDEDGALWYEYNGHKNELIREKHWWPQGEAMVGFFNAWQNTGSEIFLKRSVQIWRFTQSLIIDKERGEWYWGVTGNYSVMKEDKVGLWKCPYHNSRACMEIIRRIDAVL